MTCGEVEVAREFWKDALDIIVDILLTLYHSS